ncbi:DNA/RNA nuclease SfsA [Acidaminobacter sp. JC074]|uniref:DNA/RNA nuclease SfsA n=1 Tax=Acidaminobacter sp. JC074 TaxID=2530199 RepID=UPI001F10EE98|nr:DNA/RNA nuclease SfsA [Acidaminobacter sp. JC074]MCH4888609.1 DNA/RNA nuclease SfsA [Acidaminobacter sp. JC074]
MKYNQIYEGKFIKRVNRFIAHVDINGQVEVVHVKNTGRCKELFIEGRKVFLQKSDNPNRKTKYSLIAIYKDEKLINIDSQVPNQVIYEAIENGQIHGFDQLKYIKREQTYGNSRFDIYYETESHKGYIEVKGVTLENDGIAMFPDAPTVRGTKHVRELIKGQKEGYKNYIMLLIQMKEVHYFKPNHITDPDFASALKEAKEAGVTIKCYTSTITEDSIEILKEIEHDYML